MSWARMNRHLGYIGPDEDSEEDYNIDCVILKVSESSEYSESSESSEESEGYASHTSECEDEKWIPINVAKVNHTLCERIKQVSPRMRGTDEYEKIGINEIVDALQHIGPQELIYDDLVLIANLIEAKLKLKFPDMDKKTISNMEILSTLNNCVRAYQKEVGAVSLGFYLPRVHYKIK
jgi:hypothetical protein